MVNIKLYLLKFKKHHYLLMLVRLFGFFSVSIFLSLKGVRCSYDKKRIKEFGDSYCHTFLSILGFQAIYKHSR